MMVRNRVKELRKVPAKSLIPHPSNWRVHGKKQKEALQGILAEVGYADAILARELEGGGLQIIDGHLRAETTPDMEVPVLILDVNEEEAKKLLLTLDPLAALAEADGIKVEELLRQVQTESSALADLYRQLSEEAAAAPDRAIAEDDAPEPLPVAVTRPGDLWILEGGAGKRSLRHRLLCGNSTEPGDVDRLMDGKLAELVATDPPYLVEYTGDRPEVSGRGSRRLTGRSAGGTTSRATGGATVTKTGEASGGTDLIEPGAGGLKATEGRNPSAKAGPRRGGGGKDWSATYREVEIDDADGFFRSVFANVLRVLAPHAAVYCWHAHKRQALIARVWEELGIHDHQQVIWVKPTAVFGRTFYHFRHEPCMMGWRKNSMPRHDSDHTFDSVWEIDWEGKSRIIGNEHPTQKPLEVFARPMRKHTIAGALCFEPFSGSGSQLVAAEQMGRVCYAMELEPVFVDVAIRRWQKLTGRHATLDGSGSTWAQVAAERGVPIPATEIPAKRTPKATRAEGLAPEVGVRNGSGDGRRSPKRKHPATGPASAEPANSPATPDAASPTAVERTDTAAHEKEGI